VIAPQTYWLAECSIVAYASLRLSTVKSRAAKERQKCYLLGIAGSGITR
jgi:hypothetical protein